MNVCHFITVLFFCISKGISAFFFDDQAGTWCPLAGENGTYCEYGCCSTSEDRSTAYKEECCSGEGASTGIIVTIVFAVTGLVFGITSCICLRKWVQWNQARRRQAGMADAQTTAVQVQPTQPWPQGYTQFPQDSQLRHDQPGIGQFGSGQPGTEQFGYGQPGIGQVSSPFYSQIEQPPSPFYGPIGQTR